MRSPHSSDNSCRTAAAGFPRLPLQVACLKVVEVPCSLQVSILLALQLTCPPVAHRDELQALHTGRCKLPAA